MSIKFVKNRFVNINTVKDLLTIRINAGFVIPA